LRTPKIEFDDKKITLHLSSSSKIKAFTLEDPLRLVIDLPDVKFGKYFKKDITSLGFKKLRSNISQDKLRLVLDLKKAIKIGEITNNLSTDQNSYKISIEVKSLDNQKEKIEEGDKQMSKVDFSDFIANKIGEFDGENGSKNIINTVQKKYIKPIIVIDAGHGGKDSGAIGRYLRTKEKNITLSYSKELYRQLKESGRYQVYMTRDDDEFISLRKRVQIARKKKANLFLSIHANAADNRKVSGFSIYTLSEKSSDKQAAMLARKENRADILSGINFSGASQDIVKTMIAMSQRDSMNYSARFAKFSVNSMQNSNINILRNAHRFAGFVVLTAPDMISVLVELGYLTNYREEKKLNGYSYRRKVAKSLVSAIDQYFARHPVTQF